jgi:hypothetical protein
MVNITADECLQASLSKVTEVAAIRDGDGNMIGIYKPWPIAEQELYEQAEKLFDREEFERRVKTETRGHTIEEVMRHLQSLENSEVDRN